MKPLVEATVFDETGSMRVTFFNQPWLAQRYEPGTRLVLHGKTTERGTFNVAHHAVGGSGRRLPVGRSTDRSRVASRRDRPLPGDRGRELDADPGARAGCEGMRWRTCPRRWRRRGRVSEGLPDRASALAAMHFPRDGEDRERGRERLAFEELLLTQLVFLRRRARRRESTRRARAGRAGGAERALAAGGAAVRADRRSAQGGGGDSARSWRAYARCRGC